MITSLLVSLFLATISPAAPETRADAGGCQSHAVKIYHEGRLQMPYQEGGITRWREEFYIFYMYQVTLICDNRIENSSFGASFGGCLDKGKTIELTRYSADGRYVYYENEYFRYKISAVPKGEAWCMPKTGDPELDQENGWQKVSE